jgi:hypothetical protein
MTIGNTNLTKIVKDSKLLFYNRQVLQKLDMIRGTHLTHVTLEKSALKGILLRLKRFHKSFICTIPKTGKIFNLVQYLQEKPNYCEKTEIVLKKGLLSHKQNKRFQKKFYIFGFVSINFDIINMLRWFGHAEEMDERRLTKEIFEANLDGNAVKRRLR